MKIVAVSSVKDETDILPKTVSHLLGEGIDRCIISNGGGTPGVYKMRGVIGCPQEGPFDQGAEITRLSYLAVEAGADWIIPFDADEFWIDPLGGTIRSVLEALPGSILKVHCAVFKHLDWDTKLVTQNPLGKVAFRPSPEMKVAWGNHDVWLSQGGDEEHGLLEIRELQYRDYDHFLQKVKKARDLFASWEVPQEHGHHMRLLTEATDLQTEYDQVRGGETVADPIPYKGTV